MAEQPILPRFPRWLWYSEGMVSMADSKHTIGDLRQLQSLPLREVLEYIGVPYE